MAGYQILGIRSFFDEKTRKNKKYDAFFEMRWRFDDIKEIFTNPVAVLDRCKVPETERYNLYYTIASCDDTKRGFAKGEIRPFDIDGIDITRRTEYIQPVFDVLKLDAAKTTVVFSGNGLHFIIALEEPITDKAHFDEYRAQYHALCSKIDARLEELRLPGKADRGVFDAARILRIPGTLNRKADKLNPEKLIERMAEVIHPGDLSPQEFDLEKKSGLKKLDRSQAIPLNELKKYRRADGKAALEECLFLKHVKDDAGSLNEPEWYAAASIVARFEKGRELFHEISKGHRGYHSGVTDDKLDQAVAASGPRTCSSIQNLWGKCRDCPHFEKITSPVVIFGKDVIPSEATGFYDILVNDKGVERKIPNYNDLLAAFKRDYGYFTHSEAERAMIFDGTCWRPFSALEIQGYAEKMFQPAPMNKHRTEFAAKVLANYQRPKKEIDHFFRGGIKGKLNLKNGILDIKSGLLSEHTSELGFTYVLPYDYVEGKDCPTFKKFLVDITCGNKDLAASLLDFMGYLLIPTMDDHCFLWLAGSGRNGKSTFIEILQALVGEENTSAVMLDQFESENQLEMMNHKLLNLSEESDGRRIPGKIMAKLKALSAGGQIMVNQKYEKPYAMRPTAKLVFASNVRPKIEGAGQAIASRMILVPFNMQLENYREGGKSKVDPRILEKMKEELPGILNLALSRVRLQADAAFYRVHRAKESGDEVQNIFLESDSIESWLADEIALEEGTTPTKDLYASYKKYMEENHPREFLPAIRQFSSSLRAKLAGKIEKTEIGHEKVAGFKGIRLRKGTDF